MDTVADTLDEERSEGEKITADVVRTRLREIAWHRNNIAHTADRDPDSPTNRAAITADEAVETIKWLEAIAAAIHKA